MRGRVSISDKAPVNCRDTEEKSSIVGSGSIEPGWRRLASAHSRLRSTTAVVQPRTMASVDAVAETRIAAFELAPRSDAAIATEVREFAERVSRFPFVTAIELWQGSGLLSVTTAVAPWSHAHTEAILAVQLDVTRKYPGVHVGFHLVNTERRREEGIRLGPMAQGTTALWRRAGTAAS
jgi:hypothetical protein